MTREEAIKILNKCRDRGFERTTYTIEEYHTARDMAIKTLEQEPCEDAISRQAVLDMATTIQTDDYSGNEIIEVVDVDDVKALPPVTPQPKTGHWIEKDGFDGDTYYDCSECGESWTTIMGTPWDNGMAYCPNCGAKMIEPQGSEE